MSNLEKIQKVMQVLQILSKILLILAIVGLILTSVGAILVALGVLNIEYFLFAAPEITQRQLVGTLLRLPLCCLAAFLQSLFIATSQRN